MGFGSTEAHCTFDREQECLPQEAIHTWRESFLILKVWNLFDATFNETAGSLGQTADATRERMCAIRPLFLPRYPRGSISQVADRNFSLGQIRGKHPPPLSAFTCVSAFVCKASWH